MSAVATVGTRTSFGCRVWERFSCDLPTACQPVASRNDKDLVWAGTIRDISIGGVGLVLPRRFEPGIGLTIELPAAEPGMAETLLARVVYARRLPEGNWHLGCAFISRLSEQELESVLEGVRNEKQPTSAPVAGPGEILHDSRRTTVVIDGMTFESEPRHGRVVRLKVNRLVISGQWPPAPGTVLRVKLADSTADKIHVTRCWQHAGRWTIAYQFLGRPSAGLQRLFGHTS